MDKICEFPTCIQEFTTNDRGAARRKYCKPHSEIVRKAKIKLYSQKTVALAKLKTIQNKIDVGNRCVDCGKDIFKYTLKKKYCDSCQVKRTALNNRTSRKRRGIQKCFERTKLSIFNNIKVYINKNK